MAFPPASPPFTRADWSRLPEGFPAQLVDGYLVKEPGPVYGHQWLAGEIVHALQSLVGRRRALPGPFDVVVDDLNVYQPDVVVLREPLAFEARDVRAPLLVVEILSPSTARRDREIKRVRLLDAGTGEVWLVDPATRTIEVHDVRDSRRATGNEPLASRALPGFVLTPQRLFANPA